MSLETEVSLWLIAIFILIGLNFALISFLKAFVRSLPDDKH